MARRYVRSVARGDTTGAVVVNALATFYEVGTTTEVTDLYSAASGGSADATLISNTQGEVAGYLANPRPIDVVWTDNSLGAYLSHDPLNKLPAFSVRERIDVTDDGIFYIEDDNGAGFGASTSNTAAQNTLALQAALDAADFAGGGTVTQRDQGVIYTVAIANLGHAPGWAGLVYSNTTVLRLRLKFDQTYDFAGYPFRIMLHTRSDVMQSNVRYIENDLDGATGATTGSNEAVQGISVAGTDIWVVGNKVHHFAGDAIKCGEATGGSGLRIRILDNDISTCWGQAVALADCTDFTISHNYIHGSTNANVGAAESIIISSGTLRGIITDNHCDNFGTISVESQYHVISGNYIAPGPYAQACVTLTGVNASTTGDLVVSDNICDPNRYLTSTLRPGCITVFPGPTMSRIKIIGNSCKRANSGGTYGPGIAVVTDAVSDNIVISDNTVFNGGGTSQADIHFQLAGGSWTNVSIAGNTLTSGGTGIFLTGSTLFSITGNTCHAISLVGANYGTVSGNTVFADAQTVVYVNPVGVGLRDCQAINVTSNNLDCTSGVEGVKIMGTSTTKCFIQGNIITCVDQACVIEAAGSDYNVAVNNYRPGANTTVTMVGANSVGTPNF